MLCGRTNLITLPIGELTLRQLVLRYGNKPVWESNQCAIPECSYCIIALYNFTIISHLSDGKVDAVTFGTGTGGTLSGQYHSVLSRFRGSAGILHVGRVCENTE